MSLTETDLTPEVLQPGDHGYDDAANVFFASGRPALVVRPRDPDEVAAALHLSHAGVPLHRSHDSEPGRDQPGRAEEPPPSAIGTHDPSLGLTFRSRVPSRE